MRNIDIGAPDFRSLRESGGYYVDKTAHIRGILSDGGRVSIYTRPRRFGKTLTLSMLAAFLEIDRRNPGETEAARKLFSGLSVLNDEKLCEEYLSKWPVIFLPLKDIEGPGFELAAEDLKGLLCDAAIRYRFLLSSDRVDPEDREFFRLMLRMNLEKASDVRPVMKRSLAVLERMLWQHFGKRVFVLVDEYDVPLNKARENGYYKEMMGLIRPVFSLALKDNPAVEKAVLTGCLRISKESVFTGLNQFVCNSVTSEVNSSVFGFTRDEARRVLADFGLSQFEEEARARYDGYRFGTEEIYCPWDLMNFCNASYRSGKPKLDNFWINTSSNDLLDEFLANAGDDDLELMKTMLSGQSAPVALHEDFSFVEIDREHSAEMLMSLLCMTGYLTKTGETPDGLALLRIPNSEIRECFERKVKAFFSPGSRFYSDAAKRFGIALADGDAFSARESLAEVLRKYASVRDGGTESFYHGLALGLLSAYAEKGIGRSASFLESNREGGDGYPDIAFADGRTRKGVILELKKADGPEAMGKACQEALAQIKERRYWETFDGLGLTSSILYGIAFSGKDCRIACEEIPLPGAD